MTCGDCGKLLVERTVATKTKKVNGDVIVLAQRQALVCDEHGVVAWDPTHPVSYPVPYVPYVPVRPIPYWNPAGGVQPWRPAVLPYITYGGGTNQLSANQCAGGIVNGNSTRALATVA